MAITLPTTAEQIADVQSKLEAKLGQDSPILAKAFVRVLATILGVMFTSLNKLVIDREKQTLAISATHDEDLERIGNNYGVYRTPGSSAEIVVQVVAEAGAIIDANSLIVGSSNNLEYYPDQEYTMSGTDDEITIVCVTPGEAGNTAEGDEFVLSVPISGVSPILTQGADAVSVTGADREDIEDYRRRVLNVIRTVGGGGNSADYREWAEAYSGVSRAFPYASTQPGATVGDREVYIEADESLFDDGIPDSAFLAQVKDAIEYDPDTGDSRIPLGLTSDTLEVLPITRTEIFVEISDLTTPSGQEAAVQSAIETALETYLADAAPFIIGLDSEVGRADKISTPGITSVVWQVCQANASTVSAVVASLTEGGADIGVRTLGAGELTKLGTVTYV